MTPAELSEALKRYRFYHAIDLGGGIVTPGIREFMSLQEPVLAEIRRAELRGKRVLDVGCRDGLFSFEAERRGGSVVAIDRNPSSALNELLIPWFKSSVEVQTLNVYDLRADPEKRFDYVIFAGVLYHLRMPFEAIKRIADVMNPGGTLLIETALMLNHQEHPFVYVPAPASSPYEPTSVTFFNHRALVDTLECMGFENVECRTIISPHSGHPRYDSWDAFCASSDPSHSRTEDIAIGRGTYLCRRSPDHASEHMAELSRHWFGTSESDQTGAKLRELFGFIAGREAVTRAFASVSGKSDPPKRS